MGFLLLFSLDSPLDLLLLRLKFLNHLASLDNLLLLLIHLLVKLFVLLEKSVVNLILELIISWIDFNFLLVFILKRIRPSFQSLLLHLVLFGGSPLIYQVSCLFVKNHSFDDDFYELVKVFASITLKLRVKNVSVEENGNLLKHCLVDAVEVNNISQLLQLLHNLA